ncbi:hypothetical protein CROQUDRAFT_544857 [Cronartium quercuum f. sp. fusiforme G11]|uniref:DUF2470 domain-containing protein n=1 Tax=Cronartium quercuum f. sp. fusiforme G11 TaxID=708437 RepID=A0A9P6NTS1_9BASI|nr:hypothetical protein CROQUDRAFT_544857 [Cronartium quercuum f. sp. fusiforme G11]
MDAISDSSDRYCSHMNEDHSDAILYCKSWPGARKARMLSINAREMEFEFETLFRKRLPLKITFDPILQNSSEVRPRLIDMMNEAIDNLGLSRVEVNTLERPCSSVIAISLLILRVSALYLIPVAHVGEALFILRPKLRQYRVSQGNQVYWYASCLLAGMFLIYQFGRLAAAKVNKKDIDGHHKKL